MQRNISELLDNLELDPFAEDENNPSRSYALEGENDDFEVVAAKLNARRNDDDPLLAMRAMLNDTPYTKREEKSSNKAHSSSSHKKNPLEELTTATIEQKTNSAQKQIKSQLRILRNRVKHRYREMKANEKNALPNTALGDAVKSDQQSFVDYLLGEVAGIPKFNTQFQESKENKQLTMQPQLNPEYLHFKDVHYHKLVVCLVTFLQAYNEQGLQFFSRFSGLQMEFRRYLYKNIEINQANISEIKQNPEPGLVVAIPDPKQPPSQSEVPHIANPDERLCILRTLERLCLALQNLTDRLGACLRHIIPSCCFFSRKPDATQVRVKKEEVSQDKTELDYKHESP